MLKLFDLSQVMATLCQSIKYVTVTEVCQIDRNKSKILSREIHVILRVSLPRGKCTNQRFSTAFHVHSQKILARTKYRFSLQRLVLVLPKVRAGIFNL
jgi:hypothetical protein